MSLDLDKAIEIMKEYLEAGHSVGLATKKAGISIKLHQVLLKDPEYLALVTPYYQKNKSAMSILSDKIDLEKKYLPKHRG